MKVLALECGAEFWGLALAQIEIEREAAARLLSATVCDEPRALSRELFVRMQDVLEAAGISLGEVHALAVGIGPGSWTGLRIGLTAMKTLAQTRELPLAGVPSFDCIAQAVWRTRIGSTPDAPPQLLLVAEKSRPGELYGKLFECGDEYLGIAQKEWIGTPQLLADTLSTEALARELELPLLLAGNAAPIVAEILEARGEEYSRPRVSREEVLTELALSGAIAIASDEAADPLALSPLYLAPSNAERSLLKSSLLKSSLLNE
jgi:tRNA threonylcarbamoyladenosine biosynthesis protein TsaB